MASRQRKSMSLFGVNYFYPAGTDIKLSSAKMYKDRIKKWGFAKYNKEAEMRAIMQKHIKGAGRPTRFMLGMRRVETNDVKRFLKRSGITVEDIMSSRALTPPDLRSITPEATSSLNSPEALCLTPRATTATTSSGLVTPDDTSAVTPPRFSWTTLIDVPRGLDCPAVFKVPESLFANIQTYIRGSWDAGIWVSRSESHLCVKADDPDIKQRTGLGSLYDNLRIACDLFQRGKTAEAGLHLSRGFKNIETILSSQSPLAPAHFPRVIAYLLTRNHPQIALMACRQFSDMARTILPQKHPFRAVFSHLAELIHENMEEISLLALQSVVDAFEKVLGPFHMHTVYTAHIMMDVMSMTQGPEAVEARLTAFSQACEQHCGPSAIQTLKVSIDLAQNILSRQQFANAELMGWRIVDRASALLLSLRTGTVLHTVCEGYRIVAEAQSGQGEFDRAEVIFRKIIALCDELWQPDISAVMKYRAQFIDWLIERGKLEEAASVQDQKMDLMRRVDTEADKLVSHVTQPSVLHQCHG